jgi:hypothetical protein
MQARLDRRRAEAEDFAGGGGGKSLDLPQDENRAVFVGELPAISPAAT